VRIHVIGAGGQVGTEVMKAAAAAHCDALAIEHAEMDVTDREAVDRRLSSLERGDVVVDTAAFHRTDECEDQPERAFAVNAVGAAHVAAAARRREAIVMYLSSDYVFDGAKRAPYVESDVPGPINVYGVSKLAGEMLVAQTDPRSYLIRISSVFGPAGSSGKGGNFVEAMLAKARRGEQISVVDDLVMAPTSAVDASALMVALAMRRAPFGVYHLSNAGACSWCEFAAAIFEDAGLDVRPTPTVSDPATTRAKRPAYSVLASERLDAVGLHARPWRDGLRDYLIAKGHIARVASGER